jgi:hypothetical protein
MGAVLVTLEIHRFPCWRNNTGAARYKIPGKADRFVRFGVPGAPDVLGLVPGSGRLLAIECKRSSGGRLTDAQRDMLSKIQAAGAIALVVATGQDLRHFHELLESLKANPHLKTAPNW